MRLRSLKIRAKLMASAIGSVIVLVFLAVLGLNALNGLESVLSDTRANQGTVRLMASIQKALVAAESGLRAYLKQGDERQLDNYRNGLKTAQDGLQRLKTVLSGNEVEAKQIRDAEAALANWQTKVAEPALASRKKTEISRTQGDEKAGALSQDLAVADLSALVATLMESRLTQTDRYLSETEKKVNQTRTPMLVSIALFSTALLMVTYFLSGPMSRRVTAAADLAEAISKGDLSRRIKVKGFDEVARLGSSLNEMADDLTNYSRRILEGIDVLTTSVTQIASAASELFSSASQTASAVTETSNILNEMAKTAKIVNDTSRNVEDHSRHSDEVADAGTRATGETIEKIGTIREKMEIVGKAVVGLSDNTKFVEEIVATVQDIADQSNLLAVNASIEAARSGQHGKGFAVVAQEIKSLADQSREATDRVNKILYEIRKSVGSVVMATEEGSKAVQSGVTQSEAAGESIQKLSVSISEFSRAAGLITSNTNKQFARAERVATAMRNVELAMNSSVEGSTQLENEAKRLEELARSLRDIVQHYRIEHAS